MVNIDISQFVTEYRSAILEDEQGHRYVAVFPESIPALVRSGVGVKADAVCIYNCQLIPYNRIEDHFEGQLALPLRRATVLNFNQEVYRFLRSGPQILDSPKSRIRLPFQDAFAGVA